MADPADRSASGDAGEPEQPVEESVWRRRRRLAEVFGEALPETTSDERDDAPTPSSDGEDAKDRWLRSQVPPHHG
jgi:hypothetical protein